MKRLIFAIAVSLFAVCLAIFEVFFIDSKANEFYKDIDEISAFVNEGNKDEAAKMLQTTIEKWEETSRGVNIFLQHEEIEAVMEDLRQMKVMVEKDSVQFYFLSAKAKQQLQAINENELPLIDNIL